MPDSSNLTQLVEADLAKLGDMSCHGQAPGPIERQDSGWARRRPVPQRGWQARLDPVLKVVCEFRTRQTASCHDSV